MHLLLFQCIDCVFSKLRILIEIELKYTSRNPDALIIIVNYLCEKLMNCQNDTSPARIYQDLQQWEKDFKFNLTLLKVRENEIQR